MKLEVSGHSGGANAPPPPPPPQKKYIKSNQIKSNEKEREREMENLPPWSSSLQSNQLTGEMASSLSFLPPPLPPPLFHTQRKKMAGKLKKKNTYDVEILDYASNHLVTVPPVLQMWKNPLGQSNLHGALKRILFTEIFSSLSLSFLQKSKIKNWWEIPRRRRRRRRRRRGSERWGRQRVETGKLMNSFNGSFHSY